jgi:hypothetical protein
VTHPITSGAVAHVPQPPAVSDDVWAVVRTCWQQDPAARPSAKEMVATLARAVTMGTPRSATEPNGTTGCATEAPLSNGDVEHAGAVSMAKPNDVAIDVDR